MAETHTRHSRAHDTATRQVGTQQVAAAQSRQVHVNTPGYRLVRLGHHAGYTPRRKWLTGHTWWLPHRLCQMLHFPSLVKYTTLYGTLFVQNVRFTLHDIRCLLHERLLTQCQVFPSSSYINGFIGFTLLTRR